MPAFVFGLLTGGVLGIVTAVLSLLRKNGEGGGAAAVNFFCNLLLTGLAVMWPAYGLGRPTTTVAGLLPLFLVAIILALVWAAIADAVAQGLSAAPVVALIAVIAVGITWAGVHNGPHDARKAAFGIVHVTIEPGDALPASSTEHLVIVTPDEAATKASQAMSSGEAATRNFASYLDLGAATLQRVDGQMVYVFALQFDGSGNKARLHGVEPGYIMVSAENPNAPATERYAPQFPYASMIVSAGAGQGAEPARWARSHGWSSYLLDDPTLEIRDDGHPFWTVTLLRPQLGSTFFAPVGVLLIDAHTGSITHYDLPGHGTNLLSEHAPWVDRVFSENMAATIAGWYGKYAQAGWPGIIGSSNANRTQVSGEPVLTYTGDENPSWRMLLTSFNAETSVSRIIEFDAATGAMRVYQPASAMGIEETVAQAFCNAQGTGAGNVRNNHLVPEHMSLHVIYGQLVWMASYESSQNNGGSGDAPDQGQGDSGDPCGNGEAPALHPTFTGIGFVPAYSASASNAVFGNTRAAALQNLLTQLAGEQNANGNTPGADSTETAVTGKICEKDVDPGTTATYYVTLCGTGGKPDFTRVYTGTSGLGAAIVLAHDGDDITMRVLKVTVNASEQDIQAFSDKQHPVSANGNAAPAASPSASASATPPATTKAYRGHGPLGLAA